MPFSSRLVFISSWQATKQPLKMSLFSVLSFTLFFIHIVCMNSHEKHSFLWIVIRITSSLQQRRNISLTFNVINFLASLTFSLIHILLFNVDTWSNSLKQKESRPVEQRVNHQHLFEHREALRSRILFLVPSTTLNGLTSEGQGLPQIKCRALEELLTAQIQCKRRPKWPDNHIFTNLSQGQTNVHRVWKRQVAF